MPATIIVNNMTVVHRKSGGVSTAFPDVCKTPSPGGPIPIPYPNVAMSADTAKGSKKVSMDGEPIMLESSNFKMSSGDEAGSAMGVVSNKNKGKAYPKAWSVDVKVEGKAVFRQLDIMLQNGGSPTNTPPGPEAQAPAVSALDVEEPEFVSVEWNSHKLKCGDECVIQVRTKNCKDGSVVGVTAFADSQNRGALRTVANFAEPIQGDKLDIPWITRTGPVPENGEVKLDLFASGAGGLAMSSQSLEIEVPSAAHWDNNPATKRTVPMVMWQEKNWFRSLFSRTKGEFVPRPGGGSWGWDYGFELDISNEGFLVKGKIKLEAPRHPRMGRARITSRKKQKWKRLIEAVWNKRWREHREACVRRDRCSCWRGCCVFPYNFECEFVSGGEHAKVDVYPGSPSNYRLPNGRHDSRFWWNSGTWFEKLSGRESNKSGVWAHEYGHVIGQYDEYPTGAVFVPTDASGAVSGQPPFPDVQDSLMGSGAAIKRNHLDEYHDWFRKQVSESYKPIEV